MGSEITTVIYHGSKPEAWDAANEGQVAYSATDATVQFEPGFGWVAVLYLPFNDPDAWAAGYEVQTPATHRALFGPNPVRSAPVRPKAAPVATPAGLTAPPPPPPPLQG